MTSSAVTVIRNLLNLFGFSILNLIGITKLIPSKEKLAIPKNFKKPFNPNKSLPISSVPSAITGKNIKSKVMEKMRTTARTIQMVFIITNLERFSIKIKGIVVKNTMKVTHIHLPWLISQK